jgi:hypothetical protein
MPIKVPALPVSEIRDQTLFTANGLFGKSVTMNQSLLTKAGIKDMENPAPGFRPLRII